MSTPEALFSRNAQVTGWITFTTLAVVTLGIDTFTFWGTTEAGRDALAASVQSAPSSVSTGASASCKDLGDVERTVTNNLLNSDFEVRGMTGRKEGGGCTYRLTYSFRLNAAARQRLAMGGTPSEADLVAEQWRTKATTVDGSR